MLDGENAATAGRQFLMKINRVSVLIDTPNIAKGVERLYKVNFRTNYQKILELAAGFGIVGQTCTLVNDGASPRFKTSLQRLGFERRKSHVVDCDEALIAMAVRIHPETDVLVLGSGDKHYRSVIKLLSAANIPTMICAVDSSCGKSLKAIGDAYLEVPVKELVAISLAARSA